MRVRPFKRHGLLAAGGSALIFWCTMMWPFNALSNVIIRVFITTMALLSRKRRWKYVLSGVAVLAGLHLYSQYTMSMQRDLTVDQQAFAYLGAVANAHVQQNEKCQREDCFDPDSYNKRLKKCFYVEDMCTSSNRWFYRSNDTKHQPNFDFEMFAKHTPKRQYGYHNSYAPARFSINKTIQLGCVVSPYPNHVILQSWYNDMLGEFYDRGLVGLFELLEDQKIAIDQFVKHSQLYLHRMNPHIPTMDSHELFTDAFRSTALGDLLQLMDNVRCRCLSRVFFCGYRIKHDPQDENSTRLEPAGSIFQRPIHGHTAIYAKARTFLRQRLILSNPFAAIDIRNFRRAILARHKELHNATRPVREWKLVGLTQRSRRRRWLNLAQVIENLTQQMLEKGIILLEVNVEDEDWTPYRQMIRHAALDALVGIHGAQLTEAIWTKPGSLVIELLPYIPNATKYGHWTTVTHRATALGIIFDESSLLHVGYRLGRETAPYCYNTTNECWGWKRNRWDERDFIAAPDIVSLLLDMFTVSRPKTCEDYENRSMPVKNVVVYNARCAHAAKPGLAKPHHFYWNKSTKTLSL